MIVIYHNTSHTTQIVIDHTSQDDFASMPVAKACFLLANRFPDHWIIWCDTQYKEQFDQERLTPHLKHKRIMISQSVDNMQYLNAHFGYIEENPFIKINPDVPYPTWFMSTSVGGMHSSLLQAIKGDMPEHLNFDYFLNSLAKQLQPQGVFCYQIPDLLSQKTIQKTSGLSNAQLFRFVKTHYKTQWVFFLFVALLIYEKQFAVFALLKSLGYKKRVIQPNLTRLPVDEVDVMIKNETVDVIIPTMGREKYLYDVLKDLAKQTVLPKQVIIVEQNGDPESTTALLYIKDESWPFKIEHQFIHQTGACNARNLAIAKTTGDWVFLADDDNRLPENTIQKALVYLKAYQAKALTTSYLQEGEKQVFNIPKQWTTFGSGNSFVAGDIARKTHFDIGYEHGYGEDTDYGMQLRNQGVDILYHPDINLLHLKAPVGGFRKPVKHAWSHELIQPKPSPTVMLYRLRHTTKEQLKGYKLRLFLRQFIAAKTMNIPKFIGQFKSRWNRSVHWANHLDTL